jgi:hypothetical protein
MPESLFLSRQTRIRFLTVLTKHIRRDRYITQRRYDSEAKVVRFLSEYVTADGAVAANLGNKIEENVSIRQAK